MAKEKEKEKEKEKGNPAEEAQTRRFQVATRFGALRDTAIVPDPFGTQATFTIRRKGCRAHQDWAKRWIEQDAFSSQYVRQLMTGDVDLGAGLSEEDRETIKNARIGASNEMENLLSILDKLLVKRSEHEMHREAIRMAVESGRTTYTRIMTAEQEKEREEAVFLLMRWDNMMDEGEEPVPHSPDTVRDLLLNDTPLDPDVPEIRTILLSQPCWTKRDRAFLIVDGKRVDGPEIEGEVAARADLTLGRAYQLFFHQESERLAIFRSKVLEAAAKNSETPSGLISSPGGATAGQETNGSSPS